MLAGEISQLPDMGIDLSARPTVTTKRYWFVTSVRRGQGSRYQPVNRTFWLTQQRHTAYLGSSPPVRRF